MGRYRKVDSRMQGDRKFRGLSDLGKLLWYTILTHKHMTLVGALPISLAGLAAELEWDIDKLSRHIEELHQSGLIEVDHDAHLILAPNFIKYNPPPNPNAIRSWGLVLEGLPDSDLVSSLFSRLSHAAATLQPSLRRAFEETFPNGWGTVRQPFPNGSTPAPVPDPDPDPALEGHIDRQKRDAQFETWWNAYPRKVAKKVAKKKWDLLWRDGELPTLTALMAVLARQIIAWQGRKAYIPHPATYLNQGRWDEEDPEPPDAGSPTRHENQRAVGSDSERQRAFEDMEDRT